MRTDDLCKLLDTTEESLMKILQDRYLSNRIYTNAGIVLISINPYTSLDLYGKHVMNAYFNSSSCDPHIYSVCEGAFQDMKTSNQTILISGESGSGKTENTKLLQEYLIVRTGTSKSLKEKIDSLTLIMESFGNAKTVLNDNSSRVGKMISYYINETIQGIRLNTFLLEKSRVTHQSKGESNFNIFYQLCKYKNLNIVNDYIDTKYNVECDYKNIKKAMYSLGIQDIEFIENILLVILNFGFMQFNYKNDEICIKDKNPLVFICEILKIDQTLLENTLLKKEIKVNGELLVINNKIEEAIIIRDSISRILYVKVFNLIVEKINKTLSVSDGPCINILDIFGFEIFKENSLDQLCINYANEKIQDDFVKKIFEVKQEEYKEEIENYEYISFASNSSLIYEMEKRCGLFDLIDEESKNKFGSIDNLRNKIASYIKKGIKVKSYDKLIIKHFIKDVEYDVTDFITKNREVKIPKEIYSHVLSYNTKNTTVISSFFSSLNSLFMIINNTQVKYIRCIKPNVNKTNTFDNNVVYNQLISTGVLQVIKISKQIFTYEMDKSEWHQKYGKYNKVLEGKTKVYFNSETKLGIEAVERSRSYRKKKVMEWFMSKLLEKKEGMNNMNYDEQMIESTKFNNEEDLSVNYDEQKIESTNFNNEEDLSVNYDEQMIESTNFNNEEDLSVKYEMNPIKYEEENELVVTLDKINLVHQEQHSENSQNNEIENSPNIEMCYIDRVSQKEGIKFKDQSNRKLNPMEDMVIELFSDQEEQLEGIENVEKIPPPNKTKIKIKYDLNGKTTEENLTKTCISDEEVIKMEKEDAIKEINSLFEETNESWEDAKKIEESEIVCCPLNSVESFNPGEHIVDLQAESEYKKIELKACEDDSESLLIEKNIHSNYNIPSPVSFIDKDLYVEEDLISNCINCTNLELKYKFVSEALKEANQKLLELKGGSPDIMENASTLYARLFHLFLDNIPSLESFPRSEMLSFAHGAFLITKRSNKNMKESVSIFIEEISLRVKYFERNITYVLFFLSNLVEYSKLVEDNIDLQDLIYKLVINTSEYYQDSLKDYIPFSITEHQELHNFKCNDSFIKKIFKPVSIFKLIKALDYFSEQMDYYCLDKEYKHAIINSLLSTVNTGVFNNLLVKKNFINFNRCIQINYNLNQVFTWLCKINYSEGRENFKHVMEVIKLVNIASSSTIDKNDIRNHCEILTGGQIMTFLMKMGYDYDEDIREKIFITSNPPEIIKKSSKIEENFVIPRYILSDELGFVFK